MSARITSSNPLDLLPDGLSEEVFQRRILDLAAWLRVKAFHSGDSRRDSSKGFPDLTLAGRCGVIFAELKRNSPKAKTTTEQDEWLARLREAGQCAVVWRPRDWIEIQRELHRIAGRRLPPDLRLPHEHDDERGPST